MVSPIQVVLNPENFHEARETGGGGPNTDFFADRDREFAQHKTRLAEQLRLIASSLEAQPETDIGYIKIILRREAWAKSHRPIKALFKDPRTPIVGGADLGVMIAQTTPAALLEIASEVLRAEPDTNWRYVEKLGRALPHPTRRRSESGAIDRVELYGADDRRDFSVEEAVAWLSNPLTGSAYLLELFEVPPQRSQWDTYDASHRRMYKSFFDGMSRFGRGLSVQALASGERGQKLLSVRLGQSGSPPTLRLSFTAAERRHESAIFDPSTVRHASLLAFLDKHPLVRRVSLPGVVVQSEQRSTRARPEAAQLPIRDATRSYPKLGIIDGGVGEALSDWVTGRWDLMADGDGNAQHGTFIGGLAVGGSSLNGGDCCPEPDGAELIDIAVFPDTDQPGVFHSYYPDGVPQFFDEVESAVADARARHGVRVYNMSLNVVQPARPDSYSPYASRLDRIADAQDVVFFISAGNLDGRDFRAEWSSDPATALAGLAAARNDGLFMPAESVRSVTVGAVNPAGHETVIEHAPSRYSRRGPGLRAGGKPDLAHIGGWGAAHPTLGHGLFSVTPDGAITDGCGTSYATPLAAKTASVLDHLIEGEVSRETLIGLLVHHAKIPKALEERTLARIARHLIGFGIPPSAHEILEKDDHEITLVIASRIRRKQQVVFRFPWPPSLVGDGGKCKGRAKLTLVASPPVDPRFGAEFVRVNIEAALQQEQSNGRWKGRLDAVYLPGGADSPIVEAELVEHGMKWSPVKMYEKTFPKGVGPSSNWRLAIEYLTRSGEEIPDDGVPFTAILTISDPRGEQPVFNEMRQTLTAQGIQIADIRTAARITPRV